MGHTSTRATLVVLQIFVATAIFGAAGMALGYHLWRLEEEPRPMARPAH
jgi:hypothetical protein